ncbi:MAG: transcriptional regulator [Firmicutes bacterium]|nr:transcriptional regulator [Bacillota bacterium]
MKLSEVRDLLEARVLWGEHLLDIEVTAGFGCDLMSDSLAFATPKCLLLTGLTNAQIIKIAEMIEANAIVFVRDKEPGPDVVELAGRKNIPVLLTNRFLFESCGLLYKHGLTGK